MITFQELLRGLRKVGFVFVFHIAERLRVDLFAGGAVIVGILRISCAI